MIDVSRTALKYLKCNGDFATALHSVQLKNLDTSVVKHNVLTSIVVQKWPGIKPLTPSRA